MTQKERMISELPYRAGDAELTAARLACRKKLYVYNNLPPDAAEDADRLIREILGGAGKTIIVEVPFRCDYGWNIQVGDNFFANYNFTVLDVAKVTIGHNVMIAPNVSLYTAGHPLHPDSRRSAYEYGAAITIGDDVWIGGSAVLLPGVTVGSGCVIAAGSVVTRDIPAGVVAAGNPCRVIRAITEADRAYYFKSRKFDVEDF